MNHFERIKKIINKDYVSNLHMIQRKFDVKKLQDKVKLRLEYEK